MPYRSSRGMDWCRNSGGTSAGAFFSRAAASISWDPSTAMSSYPRPASSQVMDPVPQARSSTVCTGMRLRRNSFSRKSARFS